MNKEIELKYKLNSVKEIDDISKDEYILSLTDETSFSRLKMKSAYFDTTDKILMKNNIAFRIRDEGNKTFSTIKWDEENIIAKGFYKRNEINTIVNDDICLIKPDIEWFAKTEIYDVLKNLLVDKATICLFEMFFSRTSFKIDYEGNIFEIALDVGEIVSENTDKKIPLLELEIELFHGDEEKLLEFGNLLSNKYSLKPKTKSKFTKGLELLGIKEY